MNNRQKVRNKKKMADIELVIKMPEEKYNWLKENNPKADKNSIVGTIVYGTPLPKDSTNGDVIKAMFPNALIREGDFNIIISIDDLPLWRVTKDWWNAPFQFKEK